MALTLIWCLMFSVVIIFIANLSLIFVDHLKVPPETFGYYQTAIMGAFFGGSMSAAYIMEKLGLAKTKIAGSLIFIAGIVGLTLLSYLESRSPLLLITAMSLASLGSALAVTIYFTFSMTHIGEHLKGSAMSLTQSLRLLISSGLVWLAASQFDGTTLPMSLCAVFCTALCLAFYGLLYRRNLHVAFTPLS
jgi:DHA1 family bicyclomycin/chloramphenicol resistance-like MFS transporter